MRKPLCTATTVAFAAFVIADCSFPAHAAHQMAYRGGVSPYDGLWSVVIQTTRGNCPAAIRAGVRIAGGRVFAEDRSYQLDGRIAPGGAVRVTISAGGQGASGFGRLERNNGWGRWHTGAGECAGQWTEARRD